MIKDFYQTKHIRRQQPNNLKLRYFKSVEEYSRHKGYSRCENDIAVGCTLNNPLMSSNAHTRKTNQLKRIVKKLGIKEYFRLQKNQFLCLVEKRTDSIEKRSDSIRTVGSGNDSHSVNTETLPEL